MELLKVIGMLEEALGKTAEKRLLPMQPGDVPATYADMDGFERATGFRPCTSVRDGIGRFVTWYREFYGVDGGARPPTARANG